MISTLAVPIKNGEHHVIGVVQLVNKDNNKPFNANDLNNLEVSWPMQVHCHLYVMFYFF